MSNNPVLVFVYLIICEYFGTIFAFHHHNYDFPDTFQDTQPCYILFQVILFL